MLSLDDQRSFTRFITPMSQTLAFLSLHSIRYRGVLHHIIFELAHHVFLPKLKSLVLDDSTANYKDLTRLITKHSNSLEHVRLHLLVLAFDSWSDVFLTLANTPMPKLDKLVVSYAFEGSILPAANGTFDVYNLRTLTWPFNQTTDNSATYARMRESFGEMADCDSDDLLSNLRQTPYYQLVKPFGLVGAQRLHKMVANLVYEEYA